MADKKANFDVVRKIALGLPRVEESTTYGVRSFKLDGKLLTCPAINKSAEPDSLAVRIDFEPRAELLSAEPDVYYVTDHYVDYPVVLVRLSRIHVDALRDLLAMAWSFVNAQASKRRRSARGKMKVGRRNARKA
jgi:hypothetical protein